MEENNPYTHTITIPSGTYACEINTDCDKIYTDEKIMDCSEPVDSVPGEYPTIRVLFYSTTFTNLFAKGDSFCLNKL